MAKQKIKDQMATILEDQIAELDEKIEAVEKKMKPYEELNNTKIRLMSARRALMGTGSRTTGNAGTKLTVDDVKAFLTANAGSSPGQVAENFGVTQSVVSSHLYRNKGQFIKKDGRYWVRDPEKGLDTADDIQEDED